MPENVLKQLMKLTSHVSDFILQVKAYKNRIGKPRRIINNTHSICKPILEHISVDLCPDDSICVVHTKSISD